MKRNDFLAAGVFLSYLSICAVSHAETLQEVINKALQTNPQAQASLNRYRAEMKNVDAVWGGYFPVINVNTRVGKQRKGDDGSSNEETRRDATVSFRQNIFSGFRTKNGVEQAGHRADAERLRLQSTLQDLSLKIVDVYLKVLERQDMIDLAIENLKMHEIIYTQIEQRTKQGVARRSDLAQIEGRRARANANVINARNNLIDTDSEFYALVGTMPVDLEQPGSWKLELPESLDVALGQASTFHPNVMAADYEIKSSEAQYDSLKSSFYPFLDIEVDHSWKLNADGVPGSKKDTTAMLRLSYNLFNGGSDHARLEEAAYQAEESRSQRDRALRIIEETLRLAWAAHEYSGQRNEYLRLHETSSRESVVAYREQFNIGKRTLLDLLDSENELFKTSENLTSSIYKEAFSRYRIFAATGLLMKTLAVTASED